MKIVDDPAE